MGSAGTTPLVTLEGELDLYHAPTLREELHAAAERTPAGGTLVVDLARVTFLDSTVLGLLVGTLRRLRENGAELELVYPPPPTDRVFALTGLDAVFRRAAG